MSGSLTLPPHLGLVQGRHGPMLFLAQDRYVGASLAAYGEFSEGETALFRQIVAPGAVVVEAGANIGAHTVFLARQAGPQGAVHAFEPQRLIFQLLCANLALNGIGNVVAHPVALGPAEGVLRVPPLDYAAAGNFGGVSLGTEAGEPVPVRPLDALGLGRLDLLKADVEGMEAAVLEGARATIARLRPVLYVENDRPAQSPALIRLVRSLGYRLWWHLPPLFSPENWLGRAENLFPGIVSINMVCIPAERPADVALPEITSDDADWRQPNP